MKNYIATMNQTYQATILNVIHTKDQKGERLTIELLIPELEIVDSRTTIFLNDPKKAQVPLNIWSRNIAEQLNIDPPAPEQHIKFLIATKQIKEGEINTTEEHIKFLKANTGKEIEIHYNQRHVKALDTTFTDLNPYPVPETATDTATNTDTDTDFELAR